MNAQQLAVRHFIYTYFLKHERPPTAVEAANEMALPVMEMEELFQQLHDGHALFLDPGTLHVRMANPLSAVPTPQIVNSQGQRYYANCAWDAFGIPAMLAADARIEAVCADCGQPLSFTIEAGELSGDEVIAHFVVPFRQWYDDIVDT